MRNTPTSTLAITLAIATSSTLDAQPTMQATTPPTTQSATQSCANASATTRSALLASGAVATAGVSKVEYASMTHVTDWHAAAETNRGAIIADPSSHLHAFGSYQLARIATAAVHRQCSTSARAAWTGAAYAMSLGVAKEVSDGWYSGFSTTDLAVDAIGAGYAVAQSYIPALRHVTPAFSLSPSALAHNTRGGGVLTNYAAQTAWLSADVHEMLPENMRGAWPSAMRLSVGRRAFQDATPDQFVVGLDLNASKLPGNNALWRRAKHVLASYRLPGPAIVFSGNGTRAFGLYW